jgi:DNA-binding transcriptional MerR regulator
MKTLPQIALNFDAGTNLQEAIHSPAQTDPMPGVGIRIKKLKQIEPEIPLAVDPVPIVETNKKQKSSRGRKSISQVAAEADLIKIPEDDILFQKQYYSMGEVAAMFRVNPSLLRFWEAEFSVIRPHKNKKGDRYFRPVDIKNLHLIYHLLRQRKYTIEGAKDFLKMSKKAEEKFEMIKKLEQIKGFFLELRSQL